MRIEWNPEYELGIAVIDQQHRRIVNFINILDRLTGMPGARVGVARVLYDLVDYTESHFDFEEALMADAGFKALDEHRRTHDSFTRRIKALQRRHEAGEDVTETLLRLLEKWLIHHILEEDARYTENVGAWINCIGKEKLGGWVHHNLRRHFRLV